MKTDTVLYADDINMIDVIFKNKPAPDISAWVTTNKLVLNLAKSKQLIFKRSSIARDLE